MSFNGSWEAACWLARLAGLACGHRADGGVEADDFGGDMTDGAVGYGWGARGNSVDACGVHG